MAELNWSDAQWQKVNNCVTEAFGKASVASAFLPCYGPLAGSTETVRNERLKESPAPPLTISLDGDHVGVNLKLVNLTVKVELSSEQVADETLSNAMLAFQRAANILAQEEDQIVFSGFQPGPASKPLASASGAGAQEGLADAAAIATFPTFTPPKALAKNADPSVDPTGHLLVGQVVDAIRRLENDSYVGPFACVLGDDLFVAAHKASSTSLVLPADRILPLLKGPLLRSGEMDQNTGIVVSLSGNAVDVVVGTPPTVQFLQRKEDAKFLFRVYERFVLRIRDKRPPTKYKSGSPVAGFRRT
jgi:uncharacterized linocin/CFP29 family protein